MDLQSSFTINSKKDQKQIVVLRWLRTHAIGK